MRLIHSLALVALVASPVLAKPAARKAPSVPVRVDPAAHKAAADELALIMVPDSIIDQQVDGMVAAVFDQIYETEPAYPRLEKRYPGLRAALTAKVRPVMVKSALQTLPLYRADLSKLYQDNLTTAEARQAAKFIASPAMQRFLAAAHRKLKFKSSAASLVQDENATTADLRTDLRKAGADAGGEMSSADQAQILAFMGSPVGRKLFALSPQKNAINTKWFNYSTPEIDQEFEVAITEGMIEHIAKTDPEAADVLRKKLRPGGTQSD